MPRFAYQARTGDGEAVNGIIEAPSPELVADQLSGNGLIPVRIAQAVEAEPGLLGQLSERLSRRRPSQVELLFFTRQMYTLTKAGVPMIQGLARLAESTVNPLMSEIITQISHELESGRELSSALARHPKSFNSLYVNMIRVGESSGKLEEAFLRLHAFLERDKQTRDNIRAAMRYPTMVIVAIAIAIGVLTNLVIPTFAKIFVKFDLQLPLATKILLAVSEFSVAYWPHLLILAFSGWYGFRRYVRTQQGRLWWDSSKLKFPVVGDIILRATLARFARAFAMASRAGVPINQSLMSVALATDNTYLGDRIRDMRNGVERGDALSRTAARSGIFPPLVLQMMSTGEETGQVDEMMEEIAEFYEQQVDYDVKQLSTYLEPLMTIVIGVMVLVLALGVFLPMWDLTQLARR
jgi:MSHA biogenesis protein MshG